MALVTVNKEGAVATVERAGYRLIDKAPTVGAGGYRIVSVAPKSSGGVLVGLAENW